MATQKHNHESVIWLACPTCGAERPLKGLVWEDLIDAGVSANGQPVIDKACPRCAYKEKAKSKPMTDAQKEKRRIYQKSRRERIAEELALARELQAAQSAAKQQEGGAE